MTVNYAQAAADSDPEALKRALNLASVVLHYDIALDERDGRLYGLCPFHDDHDPSFSVWQDEDGKWRWGCFPCGIMGDSLDFIRRRNDCDWSTTLRIACELRDGNLPDAPAVTPQAAIPPADLQSIMSRGSGVENLMVLLHERGVNVPAKWISHEFQVVDDAGNDGVLIPHFDAGANLTTIKRRWPPVWEPINVRGGQCNNLYGGWKMQPNRRRVVVCEGESDTWTVAYLLRDDDGVDVVGLPSGVNQEPRAEWLQALEGKEVTLLFDADDAGRAGTRKWLAKLGTLDNTYVRVAALPDGSDATSAGAATAAALDEAWLYVDPDKLVVQVTGRKYYRTRDNGSPVVLSDFKFFLRRLVVMEDHVVFEVGVPTKRDTQFITGAELSSETRMRRWCADRMLSWKGNSRDLADLLELLKVQALTVPRVKGTDVIGLHDGAFVMPSEVIGVGGWGYVPPVNDVELEKSLSLHRSDEGDWSLVPLWLSELHDVPDVIRPVLGWVAAAPLRSTVKNFPVLAVSGGSGWGKTTLLQTTLRAFGFWDAPPLTLTGTTPHAIQSYVGATNAFPIWFDEYRPGARQDARLALEQALRDAWDGSASVKGGQSENLSEIRKLPVRAPIIVSGENSLHETSHAERTVMVSVPKDGRNPENLRAVQSVQNCGLGRAYLEWLLASADDLPSAPALLDRHGQARAVAAWGYEVFNQFCQQVLGYELPEYEDEAVERTFVELRDTPVILQAVTAALGQFDGLVPIAWREGEDVFVKPELFCTWVDRHTDLQLPGKSGAVRDWLVAAYQADKGFRHPTYGRCTKIPGLGQVLDVPEAS